MKIILIIISSIILVGCGTVRTLGDLPSSESEFNLPLNELKKKYPDITAYDGIGYCTNIEEFIEKLGKPSKTETEIFQVPFLSIPIGVSAGGPGGAAAILIAYSMYPKQPRKYYWLKGKYLISSRVLTDISCGYDNRIHMFEWNKQK